MIIYFGVRDVMRARESVNWPTTQGIIQSSTVRIWLNFRNGKHYDAKISYDFSLHGTNFIGSWVSYGGGNSSQNFPEIQQIINRYPEGKAVTIYYAPQNPNECLLEPGFRDGLLGLPGLGAFLFFVGILMFVFYPKYLR